MPGKLSRISAKRWASRNETATEKAHCEELAQAHLAGTQARAQAEQRASDFQLQFESEVQHRNSIEAKYADARSSLEHFRDPAKAKEQREREARQQGERDAAKPQAPHAGVRMSEVSEELAQCKSRTQQLETEVRELKRRLAASEAPQDSTAQMSAQIRTLIESAGTRPAQG